MTDFLYQIENLSHAFSNSGMAVDHINLDIETGGCLALLGCNGAGKSTLLHIMAGLLSARSGSLKWRGRIISPEVLAKDSELRMRFRRQVGIVFQDPDSQWLADSVKDEVLYGPSQIWERDEAAMRGDHIMQIMGINHLADQPPYALSGGEKRRVALASVIAMDPETLLLDEPTAGLDAATMDFLLDWLQEFRSRNGKSLIMATHDLGLVRELSDRCLVLTPCHKIARFGATADVLQDTDMLRQMNLVRRRGGACFPIG